MNTESPRPPLKCGCVSIVGRPNVGKSTLLNALVGEKVSIVSPVSQTTRNRVRGILTEERGQIVFVDTPGVRREKDRLDQFMNQSALRMVGDTDVLIHLVDVQSPVGPEEERLVQNLSQARVPIILGLNKVDLGDRFIPDYIHLWEHVFRKPVSELSFLTLLPLSAARGTNRDKLLDILFEKLPEGDLLFPEDTVSDTPQKMFIADVIREKLFCVLKQEVPHSVAVLIESCRPVKGKTLKIQALILVERESQKKIVIGKNGETIKKVGVMAREELEFILEQKIYLEMYVKTKRKWRDNPSLLQEMGYQEI